MKVRGHELVINSISERTKYRNEYTKRNLEINSRFLKRYEETYRRFKIISGVDIFIFTIIVVTVLFLIELKDIKYRDDFLVIIIGIPLLFLAIYIFSYLPVKKIKVKKDKAIEWLEDYKAQSELHNNDCIKNIIGVICLNENLNYIQYLMKFRKNDLLNEWERITHELCVFLFKKYGCNLTEEDYYDYYKKWVENKFNN